MKPSEVAKNMQAAIDLLTKQREEYLAAHPDASEQEQDEWPQLLDNVFWCTGCGEVMWEKWEGSRTQHLMLDVGALFRTEAEARRRIEAAKVTAELRRMPGRCAHDGIERAFCVFARLHGVFTAELHCSCPGVAVAGVWFATEEAARHALDSIGQERLRVWLDDYLQTPIKEGGAE